MKHHKDQEILSKINHYLDKTCFTTVQKLATLVESSKCQCEVLLNEPNAEVEVLRVQSDKLYKKRQAINLLLEKFEAAPDFECPELLQWCHSNQKTVTVTNAILWLPVIVWALLDSDDLVTIEKACFKFLEQEGCNMRFTFDSKLEHGTILFRTKNSYEMQKLDISRKILEFDNVVEFVVAPNEQAAHFMRDNNLASLTFNVATDLETGYYADTDVVILITAEGEDLVEVSEKFSGCLPVIKYVDGIDTKFPESGYTESVGVYQPLNAYLDQEVLAELGSQVLQALERVFREEEFKEFRIEEWSAKKIREQYWETLKQVLVQVNEMVEEKFSEDFKSLNFTGESDSAILRDWYHSLTNSILEFSRLACSELKHEYKVTQIVEHTLVHGIADLKFESVLKLLFLEQSKVLENFEQAMIKFDGCYWDYAQANILVNHNPFNGEGVKVGARIKNWVLTNVALRGAIGWQDTFPVDKIDESALIGYIQELKEDLKAF